MKNLDYGVIGNCQSAALISREGSIDWCCLPSFDSPSIFARLLDNNKGGHFNIEFEEEHTVHQDYIRRTNILRTRFEGKDSAFEVIDFMPRYVDSQRRYHTPPDVVRILKPLRGAPKIKIDYDPQLDYAEGQTKSVVVSNYIKSKTRVGESYESIYLYSNFNADAVKHRETLELTEKSYFLLSYNLKIGEFGLDQAELLYERTKVYWLDWSAKTAPSRKYAEPIERSVLALKLLAYQKTGATLAAVTTSLPETIGEVRNWDYRYCWLRDASMTITILHKLKHYSVAERFIQFVLDVLPYKDEKVQIMYGIHGQKDLEERSLPWLEGYEGSQPVRVGNEAYIQKQNDVYGVLIDMLYQYLVFSHNTMHNREDVWTVVRSLVKHVSNSWKEPDRSIWEFRGESKHFVFSKVLCWVAADRAAKIAHLFQSYAYEKQWFKMAEEIRADILNNGWNKELGFFPQYYGGESCDAANLLMEHYGFIDSDDERYKKTVVKIYEELCKDGLMLRYNSEDDFGMPKSSFTVCTFWMIKSLFLIGQKKKAVEMFEQVLSYRNHVGLLSEDIDFKTKRLLGNFPQGYSHLALIDTALTIMGQDTRDLDLPLEIEDDE